MIDGNMVLGLVALVILVLFAVGTTIYLHLHPD